MNSYNKIKRYGAYLLAWIMLAGSVLSIYTIQGKAAESVNANYYNVMLVMDGSGSLVSSKSGTDREGYRYIAAELFLGLLTDSGNHAGAIVFDDGILVDTGIKNMSGSEAKKKLFSQIDGQVNPHGSTNIGLALNQAVKELKEAQKKNGLPSVVVMLTDGKTDLDSNPESQTAEEKKALKTEKEAIKQANKNDIKIYSVLLNGNGKGSEDEIRAMANNNKDQYAVVENAKDIQDIFAMFYTMIYGTYSNEQADKFDENGYAEVQIDIPAFGVEEVNIVIRTQSKLDEKAVTIVDPKEKQMEEEDVKDAMTISKGFTLIKLANPKAGTWKVKVKGVPGDSVSFHYVYNDNLSVKLSDITQKGTYFSGNSIKLGAAVYAGKKTISGTQLDPSDLTLTLEDASGKSYEVKPEIQAVDTGYELSFVVPEIQKATDMIASVTECVPVGTSKDGIKVASAKLHLAVNPLSDNHAPTPKKNPLQVEIKDSGDGNAYYDLKDWFSDPDEGAKLSYSILSSDYDEQTLYLDTKKNQLVAKVDEMLYGTASIQATDENGASGILNVEFLGNRPPEAKEEATTVTITKQFGASKTQKIDLKDWFTDPDGDPLTWSLVESDYEKGEVSLDEKEGTLTLSRKNMSKGSLVVRAQDDKGGYEDMTIHFKVRNLALWESIGAITILVVLAGIAIVLAVIAATRRFKGVIEVESLESQGTADNGSLFGGGFGTSFSSQSTAVQKDVFGPFHGKRYVRALMVDTGGLNKKAKFTVLSSKKACFSSPTAFYTPGGTTKKKITLSMGMTLEICSDEECTRGIRVRVKEYGQDSPSDPLSHTGGSGTFGGSW